MTSKEKRSRREDTRAGVAPAGGADKRFLSAPSGRAHPLQKRRRGCARPDTRPPLNITRSYVTPRHHYSVAAEPVPPPPPVGELKPFRSAGAGFALQGRARAPAPAPLIPPPAPAITGPAKEPSAGPDIAAGKAGPCAPLGLPETAKGAQAPANRFVRPGLRPLCR